jgi:hypothetical protein
MAWSFGRTCIAPAMLGMLCSGCGENLYETAEVTGRVTCNGKPAVGGYVVFEPIDAPEKTGRPAGNPGRIARGIVQEDGSFTLVLDPRGPELAKEGAFTGPHRISFIPPLTEPIPWDPADNWLPPEDQEKLKKELAATPVFKPLECGPEGITPTEVEVKPGTNEFEFTLQPGTASKPRVRRDFIGSS